MNVGIYIGGAGPQIGGGHAFVRAVIEGLRELESPHTLSILHSGFAEIPEVDGIKVVRAPRAPRSLFRKVTDRLRPKAVREAAAADAAAAALDRLGIQFLWCLSPAPLPTRIPYAITVWDLAHRMEPAFPEVSTTGWTWEAREAHYRRWLPPASYVIIGAEAGREAIVRSYGVSPSRIRILPLVAPVRSLQRDARLPAGVRAPYLFYPAQFWPHKNHVGLLLALKDLRERRGIDLQLVLTGSDQGNLDHVRRTTRELGLADHVVFSGFVSDAEVAALYSNATALVFPSFFGPDNLPPLEAMQLGCPVIAADVPGVAEQLGDAALLVDPRNPGSIADAIARVHGDARLRDRLIAEGTRRASAWQPRDYAAAMLRVMDEFEAERRCWSSSERYLHG